MESTLGIHLMFSEPCLSSEQSEEHVSVIKQECSNHQGSSKKTKFDNEIFAERLSESSIKCFSSGKIIIDCSYTELMNEKV